MSRQPRVAVIVLSHEDYARRYLAPCYASLKRQTYPADSFEIFVVTNGVSEDVRARLPSLAPEARIVENPENLGWGAGNNRAITVALEEGCDHVVTLNVDTIVDPDWLSALVEAAETRRDTQILQSAILLHGTARVQSFGNRLQYLGYGYCNGYGQARSTSPRGFRMDVASGAAMLVKREVFEAVGLFREDYFLYYDDVEFCWRARLAGFNVGFVEDSVCHHRYDFKDRLPQLYYFQRNRLLTLLSLERLGTLMLTAPSLILSEIVLGVYLVARGRGPTTWALLRYFLRPDTWAAIAARRREVRRIRARKDADIVKQFAGTVVFAEANPPALRYVLNPCLAMYWAIVRTFIVW